MPTATKREKREHRYSDAKKISQKQTTFESSTITIPDSVHLFNFKKAGTYKLDIIPYIVGEGNPNADQGILHYERTYYAHRGIGADENKVYCCLSTFNKPCPVCEDVAKRKRDPDEDPDVLKDLKPKTRQLWNVIDRADREKGVQVLDVSYHLFGKPLANKINHADDEDAYENFFHLDKGFTLRCGVDEESMGGNSFRKVTDIEFKTREPLKEALIEKAHCLDELLKEMTYKELKAIYLQKPVAKDTDDDEDTDDEDEDTPKKSSKKKEKTADDLGIEVGDVVKYKKKECDVIKVSGDGTSLTLEDDDGKKINAVNPADVTKVKTKDDEDEDTDDEDTDDDTDDVEDEDTDDEEDEDEEEDEDTDDEEDDEEEDEDEDEEDEDEEDEEPKKSTKKPAKKPAKKPSRK